MRGLMILLSAGLLGTFALWTDGPAGNRAAAAQQKKSMPKKKLPNELDGATWAFTAANGKGEQVIRFNYRAGDYVLYDSKTDAVIGKVDAIKQGRSRVIFNDKSQFATTFAIENKGFGHWTGRARFKDDDWTVTLRRLTR